MMAVMMTMMMTMTITMIMTMNHPREKREELVTAGRRSTRTSRQPRTSPTTSTG